MGTPSMVNVLQNTGMKYFGISLLFGKCLVYRRGQTIHLENFIIQLEHVYRWENYHWE
jgi:hypothetical protein